MLETQKHIEQLRGRKILILYSQPNPGAEAETWISSKTIGRAAKEIGELGLSVFVRAVSLSVEEAVLGFSPGETIVLNWCEGLGVDGNDYWSVPRELERLGFVYTGSSPESLEVTTDKLRTKEILISEGIPTPKYFFYDGQSTNGWNLFPALVKPAREHSSYGITRESVVDTEAQMFARAKELIADFGNGVVVEQFIDGREYNLAIWGGIELEVLPIPVIDFAKFPDYHDRLVVYDAKWHEDSEGWKLTTVICPAPMAEALKEKLTSVAIATYRVMGCRDYARVDIRVREDTPYVLDVNTNPDITSGGGFMNSAMAAGYSYGEVLVKILALAADRS